MDDFHLAYVPVASRIAEDDNLDDDKHTTPIIVRRATSLRLYRCRRSHNTYQCGSDEQKDNESLGDIDRAGHQNELCECCCCRVDKSCSQDMSLVPNSNGYTQTNEKKCSGDSSNISNNKMLAVLVPSSLTRSITNIVCSNDANKQLNVEIIELMKSIHPCLCTNELDSNTTKSNEEHERYKGRKSPPTTIYPRLSVCGIITSNNVKDCNHFPADVVLLSPHNQIIQKAGGNNFNQDHIISHYSSLLNHDTASNAPWAVLKAFPVSTISVLPLEMKANTNKPGHFDVSSDLPCCPVCLNLIEPTRLGLPDLKPHHKCTQWCSNSIDSCVNEMKLLPWPPPSHCIACQAIAQRGENAVIDISNGFQRSLSLESPSSEQRRRMETNENQMSSYSRSQSQAAATQTSYFNSCHECGLSTTLWVCLTCGIVGCGRYTHKHAAQHYTLEGHPYSLELATGRIWDYDNGCFVHRRDLVDCPVLSMKWGIASIAAAGGECPGSPLQYGAARSIEQSSFSESNGWRKEQSTGLDSFNGTVNLGDSVASCHNNQYTTALSSKLSQPKKSIMLSEEYETLLQSALEDQSQHYEGETARLRAELALSLMQETQISDRESREIHALKQDSERLKHDIEELSSLLLTAQTSEAKNRSMSQRLLREQSISKELLDKIRTETIKEHEQGKQRVEDLEMQISDLTANLRMMSEFANNEELSQAQIVGTIGGDKEGNGKKQRGKKNRRGKKRG